MKTKKSSRLAAKFLLIPIISLNAGMSIRAATITWDGDTSSTFSTAGNWVGGVAPANSISTDLAAFGAATTYQPSLTAARSVKGLSFSTTNWTLSGGANVLSIGASGIFVGTGITVGINTATAVNSGPWNVSAGSTVLVTQTATASGAFTKSGAGLLQFNAGLSATSLAATAGETRLGNSDRIVNTATMTGSNNAIFNLNGYSETVSTLTMTSGFTLDFGTAAGANSMTFEDSSALAWTGTLTILNFQAGIDTLRFGTTASGLTSGQLSQIQFGVGGSLGQIDSSGYVTAVPEPSTFAMLGFAVAGLGLIGRCRR